MIPNVVGGVTTVMMIPIFDMFDVYEIYDEPELNLVSAVVAAKAGSDFPDGTRIRFGGYLRSLEMTDESTRTHKSSISKPPISRGQVRSSKLAATASCYSQ
ncbi:MAG: hypothetical protein ACKVII_17710 [Planctomycetales bacterium]|jgi:hypothetical protein